MGSGDRLLQRSDCASQPELRAGGNDFQPAALSGSVGAEDQRAGSGRAASRPAVAGRVHRTTTADGSATGQTRPTRVRAGVAVVGDIFASEMNAAVRQGFAIPGWKGQ